MRPEGLKTRIFLDGGNPHETEEIIWNGPHSQYPRDFSKG